MNPQTILFMGSSGSGKGTQVALLQEYLQKKNPQRKCLVLCSGDQLRTLAKQKGFVGERVRETIEEGLLVPEFLTVWAWGKALIEEFGGEEHLIGDGTPRKIIEAQLLHDAFNFLGRSHILIISLTLSKEESHKRLWKRGRSDDKNKEDIERRLLWYETDVIPAFDFLKKQKEYDFVEVNGEQSIQDVHKEILAKTEL